MTTVRISTASDRVRVIAEDRDDVFVDGDAQLDVAGEVSTVCEIVGKVTVRVPDGTDIIVGTQSGRISVEGAAGAVAATTSSGRIEVESGTTVDARSESGRITVDRASGVCRVRAESGRVEIGASGGADVSTNSGRISLEDVAGPVWAHCVSGRISIKMSEVHDVDVESVSGRISVALPNGTAVHHLNGKDDATPTPAACDCAVRTTSVSGRIEVTP